MKMLAFAMIIVFLTFWGLGVKFSRSGKLTKWSEHLTNGHKWDCKTCWVQLWTCYNRRLRLRWRTGGSDSLCSFYNEALRTWIKTNVNKFAIWSHTAFRLDKKALRSYLKLTCEDQPHTLPNRKVSAAKDHGKNYIKVRPPLVHRF